MVQSHTRRRFLRGVAGAGVLGSVAATASATTSSDEVHTLTIAANWPADYALSVDGELRPDRTGGDFRADEDDAEELTGLDAGEWFTDTTGPINDVGGTTFMGDRFLVGRKSSPVRVDMRPQGDYDVHIYTNGERIGDETVSYVRGDTSPYSVTIIANGPTEYDIEVPNSGLTADTRWGDFRADNDDSIQESRGLRHVSDSTGPTLATAGERHFLGDRYVFCGEVKTFWVEGHPEATEFVYVDEGVGSFRECGCPTE